VRRRWSGNVALGAEGSFAACGRHPSLEGIVVVGRDRCAVHHDAVYVPPNDQRGYEINVLPERRPRQARTFRAIALSNPIVRLIWPDAMADEHQSALGKLARRVASLGHSASLARFAFIRHGVARDEALLWRPDENGNASVRTMYAGRLQNLERWLGNGKRPLVGVWRGYRRPAVNHPAAIAKSTLGGESDWFVFEDAGGERPDLLGFAHVAKCVRMSLLKYAAQPPAELISGHQPDRTASTEPHLAIVPLANVGWPYSTGDLLGFAAVLPRAIQDDARRGGARGDLRFRADSGRRERSCGGASGLGFRVASATLGGAIARIASAAPLVRRFENLGQRHPAAARSLRRSQRPVRRGCYYRCGLPQYRFARARRYRDSQARGGARSALCLCVRRVAQRHRLELSQRRQVRPAPRRHVILHFGSPVEGPVILGAGRFYGFGLCLPPEQE
jgi:CRISPR-associated protein Csb2